MRKTKPEISASTAVLEKKIAYVFSNRALLETALTHSSSDKDGVNNERLEFLGDRVLGLVIAEGLFHEYPAEAEGPLAKRHTGLVQQKALVAVAESIGLAAFLKLSAGEAKADGKNKGSILSDAMEALIGAVFLDGGYVSARAMIALLWQDSFNEQAAPPEDAKSSLQEWAQGRSLPLPEYRLIEKAGTEHAPVFTIEVLVKTMGAAAATAPNKRDAEKSAALKMLEMIGQKHAKK